jgi:hypothetical protein
MGLIRAIIVSCIIYAIIYIIQTKLLGSLSPEMHARCLVWIPLILIFLYLLL